MNIDISSYFSHTCNIKKMVIICTSSSAMKYRKMLKEIQFNFFFFQTKKGSRKNRNVGQECFEYIYGSQASGWGNSGHAWWSRQGNSDAATKVWSTFIKNAIGKFVKIHLFSWVTGKSYILELRQRAYVLCKILLHSLVLKTHDKVLKYKYTCIILFAFYRYSEADTLYNQTKALADKARERAKEAYKVALKLYTEATSIQLPVFDLDVLDGNTERIKTSVSKEKLGLGDGGSVSTYGFPIENSTTDLSLCCLFSTF